MLTNQKKFVSIPVADKISCVIAILKILFIVSSKIFLVSAFFTRLFCILSKLATVCKLFFTLWWISLIKTVLIFNSSSYFFSSVISFIIRVTLLTSSFILLTRHWTFKIKSKILTSLCLYSLGLSIIAWKVRSSFYCGTELWKSLFWKS